MKKPAKDRTLPMFKGQQNRERTTAEKRRSAEKVSVVLRVTKEERRDFQLAALYADRSLNGWIRHACLMALKVGK